MIVDHNNVSVDHYERRIRCPFCNVEGFLYGVLAGCIKFTVCRQQIYHITSEPIKAHLNFVARVQNVCILGCQRELPMYIYSMFVDIFMGTVKSLILSFL